MVSSFTLFYNETIIIQCYEKTNISFCFSGTVISTIKKWFSESGLSVSYCNNVTITTKLYHFKQVCFYSEARKQKVKYIDEKYTQFSTN